MSNLFDYLEWRGDLSFGNVPLCPVDALVLSALAYLPFERVIAADPKAAPVRLADAAAQLGEDVPPRYKRLLRAAGESVRFGELRLFAAKSELDDARGVQFSAFSALLPGQQLYVSFRGTDDTLIGWRENFRMSYECPVPAQLCALEYLRGVAAAHPLRRILAGGHSKGGNLALYAAVQSEPAVRERIRRVFNHDGPGFCDGTADGAAYREMRTRIECYVPQSSVVGVLLGHSETYRILQSEAVGLAQHDLFTWLVEGADFLYATERTAFGKRTEEILDSVIDRLSPARKRIFTEALFTVLAATEQQSVSGILSNKMRSLKAVLRSFTSLEPAVREALWECVIALSEVRESTRREKGAFSWLLRPSRAE